MAAPLRLALALLLGPASASVLSSSKLTHCVNNGTGALPCQSKMVVTVTLEHGQEQTESAQFAIREVSQDGAGTRSLRKPWRISWKKSEARWHYPLRYVQDVNAKPTERILRVGWLQCSDNPNNVDEELTCGVARLNGERVPDSEGFCCGCDLNDIAGGIPTRGSLDCGAFSMSESAHCLAFDPLWYSLFEVGRPQVFYDITVSVARPDDPAADWGTATFYETHLTLSHQQPVAAVEGGALRLELVGDFATATAPHRFESKYLAVPSRPSAHARVVRDLPLQHAMLVDRSLFDLSGLSCDKIGVSYTAFKRQSQACERPAGSCLASQLEHLHEEDAEREKQGHEPRHMVRGFCGGAVELGKQQEEGASGPTRFLACPLGQRHTTVLRMEARADDAMFVTNVASGRIVSAAAPPFQALQGGTLAEVVVVSTGRVAADFTLALGNCSSALSAGPALKVSLGPLESASRQIRLTTHQQGGGQWSCLATLYNALGAVLDEKAVHVNVSGLELTTGAQAAVERPAGAVEAEGRTVDGGTCASVCPGIFDVFCFLAHSCWSRLATLLGMSLGLLLCCCCCCQAARMGLLQRLLLPCGCPLPGLGRRGCTVVVKERHHEHVVFKNAPPPVCHPPPQYPPAQYPPQQYPPQQPLPPQQYVTQGASVAYPAQPTGPPTHI